MPLPHRTLAVAVALLLGLNLAGCSSNDETASEPGSLSDASSASDRDSTALDGSAPATPDAKTDADRSADSAAQDGGAPSDVAPILCELSPTELHDALANKDFLLIDVHVPYEGTIPGTDTSIPYNQMDQLTAYIGSNLDTKVVLTCKAGGMSYSAGNALIALGYRNICELTGGMNAWTAQSYPLAR
jgi:rhodanese-related sulfurtransferase